MSDPKEFVERLLDQAESYAAECLLFVETPVASRDRALVRAAGIYYAALASEALLDPDAKRLFHALLPSLRARAGEHIEMVRGLLDKSRPA